MQRFMMHARERSVFMRIRRAGRALQGLGTNVGMLVFVVNDTYLRIIATTRLF
jgi:hypothetical protein